MKILARGGTAGTETEGAIDGQAREKTYLDNPVRRWLQGILYRNQS